jgi:hypothetical protein
MASIINASTSGAGGVITTADASGELQIQSAGSTVATVTGSGVAVTGALSSTTGSFSGNVTLGSSVLATPTGSAPSYLCRAWVNFNGTGTVAIRASGNVSSITDSGTGVYTVNFTTAMSDANYSAIAYGSNAGVTNGYCQLNGQSTTGFGVVTLNQVGPAVVDWPTVNAAVFR